MVERARAGNGRGSVSVLASVVLPVAILLVAVAVVSGLVFGGVLQGHEERLGPLSPPTTQPTILIEP